MVRYDLNPDSTAVQERSPAAVLISSHGEPKRGYTCRPRCGTGELTRELHQQLSAQETIGIDNSETMLVKANALAGDNLHFEKRDIETFVTDRKYDLIFSNAALHWVPDHTTLFKRLAGFLTGDGQLAVQMPANDDHLSHTSPRRRRLLRRRTARDFLRRRNNTQAPLESIPRELVRLKSRTRPRIVASCFEWVKEAENAYERQLGGRFPQFWRSKRKVFESRRSSAYLYTTTNSDSIFSENL